VSGRKSQVDFVILASSAAKDTWSGLAFFHRCRIATQFMKLLSLLISAGLLVSARADLTITQKVEGAIGLSDMTVKIKGEKARIEAAPQITTIIDHKTGEITTLMNDKKQVVHISAEKAKAMAEMANKYNSAQASTAKPKLVPTGKKQTISGYEADEYTVEGGTFAATYWITTKYPDYAVILKQLQKIQPSNWDPARKGMPDYNDLPGLPLRMTVKIPGQGEITNTITAIKQDPIAEDQFLIPKDFTEVATPDFSNRQQSPSPAEKKP
jgi:hypothetical protein